MNFPQHDNPLTLAYIDGTRARTQEQVRNNLRLVSSLERAATQQEVDQCRLAAEVLIERKQA